MLNEVALASSVRANVGERMPDEVELVVAWPDLLALLLAGARVALLDDLRVVLEDVGETSGRECFLPEIVRLKPVRVGRVPGPVVVSLVERQEPRRLPLQVGAHAHLAVIHGKVHGAAAKLEQSFTRIAIALVLLDGVGDGLFSERVLELEGGDGEPVDKQPQVERASSLVTAVRELPRDGEPIPGVQRLGFGVAC